MADEIIREVRTIRHAISERCEHDVHRVIAYYREFQEELKQTGKYRFLSQPIADSNAVGEPAEATKGVRK